MIAEWVRMLVGAAVVCAVAMALCPKGGAKRVCSMACGCVMALALLSPVITLEPGTLARETAKYSQAAREVAGRAEENARYYERRVIESECEAYISDRAAEYAAAPGGVSVTARWDDGGFWYPWECTVYGAYSAQLEREIESGLGISPERITWEAGG